jgi:hypothetical protein
MCECFICFKGGSTEIWPLLLFWFFIIFILIFLKFSLSFSNFTFDVILLKVALNTITITLLCHESIFSFVKVLHVWQFLNALVYFLLIHIKETASVFVIVRILTSSAPVGSNQTIKLTFVTSPRSSSFNE